MAKDINDFYKECEVIKLEDEYDGYTGKERYAIITDLTRKELSARYGDLLKKFKPYVILTSEMGLAIKELNQNEDKFERRYVRGDIYIDCSDRDEATIQALSVDDEQTLAEKAKDIEIFNDVCEMALSALTPKQRIHWKLHFIHGQSFKEIARKEGKSTPTIVISCNAAKDSIIKALLEAEVTFS